MDDVQSHVLTIHARKTYMKYVIIALGTLDSELQNFAPTFEHPVKKGFFFEIEI